MIGLFRAKRDVLTGLKTYREALEQLKPELKIEFTLWYVKYVRGAKWK